eukprot:7391201-Prymnesium_polylepis.2
MTGPGVAAAACGPPNSLPEGVLEAKAHGEWQRRRRGGRFQGWRGWRGWHGRVWRQGRAAGRQLRYRWLRWRQWQHSEAYLPAGMCDERIGLPEDEPVGRDDAVWAGGTAEPLAVDRDVVVVARAVRLHIKGDDLCCDSRHFPSKTHSPLTVANAGWRGGGGGSDGADGDAAGSLPVICTASISSQPYT